MSEILTQNQIDELLSELLAGDSGEANISPVEEKKVKPYDFRSPKKFSKDQLKVLRSVYENFARHLAAYLSGVLRVSCQIKVDTIEEQPYFEYNNALPDSVMMGVFDFKPLEGTVLIEISNAVTFAVVEMMLGGNGSGIVLEREFTEIEIALMEKIMKHMGAFTKSSWSNFADIDTNFIRIETNSRIMQSIAMDEGVIIVVMDIEIKSIKGTVNVCIPIINLEPILEKAGKNPFLLKRKTDSEKDIQNKETIRSNIKDARIETVGVLGSAVLSFKELLNLQVGDVIKLNQAVDSDIKICIGGKTKFYGVPGIIKNKKHIKITKAL